VNTDRLRLGLVGPLPPPNGGMAMQTLQLSRLLQREGIDVKVVQTNAPYSPAWIEQLQGIRAVFRLLPYLWRVWRLCGCVDVIHLMANSGWSWQLFSAPVLWLASLRGTPVIVNYRGGEAGQYLAQSAARVRPSMAKASQLVVPSGFLKQVFGDFGFNSQIIPNIVDLELFSPQREETSTATFSFAITRNLEPIYGIEIAINALAIAKETTPQLRLLIAGSGPQEASLRALVDSLQLNDAVEFLGRLDRPEIVALYRRADAMLNPTRVDNMPNSVLEALACGLPVISTDVGGVPYIVKHCETALLIPPEDAQKMADAMCELYADQTLYANLSKNGPVEVAQYSWEKVGSQWISLYEQSRASL